MDVAIVNVEEICGLKTQAHWLMCTPVSACMHVRACVCVEDHHNLSECFWIKDPQRVPSSLSLLVADNSQCQARV